MGSNAVSNRNLDTEWISGSDIGGVLESLIKTMGLTATELSRETGILQQTINGIIRGATRNPRVETALTLATFFGISIQQLLGKEPIRLDHSIDTPRKKLGMVPLLKLEDVLAFSRGKFETAFWMECDESAHDSLFAVRTPDNLEPFVRRGSTILVDPHKEPISGDFVVVSIDGKHAMIRIFLKEGGTSFIKPFDPTLPVYTLTLDHKLLGTVTQIRFT